MCHFSLAAFKILLVLNNSIMLCSIGHCIGVLFFMFLSMEFGQSFFQIYIFVPLSLSSPLGTPIIYPLDF